MQNEVGYTDVGNVDYYDSNGYNGGGSNQGRYNRFSNRPNLRTDLEGISDFATEFPFVTMGGLLLAGVSSTTTIHNFF